MQNRLCEKKAHLCLPCSRVKRSREKRSLKAYPSEKMDETCIDFCCPICGNKDIHSIGFLNGKPYCRRCITFKGEEASYREKEGVNAYYALSYELSPEQKELSERLVDNYNKGIDSLVNAVCGSGKTEICLKLIKNCVQNGLTVGFAVPRRSVCYELKCRLQSIFAKNNVIAVFGGHHNRIIGDIICLTTHQLFRYKSYFDLLIIDEIDAFPFKGNQVLKQMFINSVKGHYVLLTATPSKELIEEYQKPGKDVMKLAIRFHRHPLPVPKVLCGGTLSLYYKLVRQLRVFLKNNKQVFIFVPTIDHSKKIAFFLKLFFRCGTYINSKRKDNNELIESFRNKKYMYLVTTAVLERGVTIRDLQVIVFHADHDIYDSASLIQISGRVGRRKDAPEGEVVFFAKRNNEEIQRAIDEIKANNKILQNMLQGDKNK